MSRLEGELCPCGQHRCPRPKNGIWTDDKGKVRFMINGRLRTKRAYLEHIASLKVTR